MPVPALGHRPTSLCRCGGRLPYTARRSRLQSATTVPTPSPDFAAQVEALRPQLMRYARSQLRNEAWAEDAVSDTLLAALEKPQAFAGLSQLKTWLVGVLKHKLVDQLRKQQREATVLTQDDDEDIDAQLFDASGHWREPVPDWGNPELQLGQQQFIAVLEACCSQLPPVQGRVFMMREWLELETDEICKALAITPTNLWVLLHRARLRLRECLQQRWLTPTRTLVERLSLRLHWLACSNCARFADQSRQLRGALDRWRSYRND
ncbi:MAG: RNA polymerase subunit sigma [Burkholderiales bacterium PBB5]|nr:MAG: RNA polymerase subunit sigma [Burkholderiales bacterium PBB5]